MSDAMPGLALLIAKHKPKDEPEPDSEMDDEDGGPDIHAAIAKAILKAVDDHDAMELTKCLKDFVELCHEPEGKAESEEDGY